MFKKRGPYKNTPEMAAPEAPAVVEHTQPGDEEPAAEDAQPVEVADDQKADEFATQEQMLDDGQTGGTSSG